MVTLLILDGFGYRRAKKGNSIKLQGTPNLDKLNVYPHTLIEASGEAVGLTKGQMGNSEVGHMNIGAGRVIYQDMLKIGNAIKDGSFYKNPVFLDAISHAKKNNSSLHLIGLCSDGGVHSHIDHLKALVELASRQGLKKVCIHAITDGRDTLVDSGVGFLKKIQAFSNGKAKIVDVCGRVYAMDREKRWDRLKIAYDLYTAGKCDFECDDAIGGLQQSYQNGVMDEFVKPIKVRGEGTIADGDSVIFFNYRTDRAREMTAALTQDNFDGFEREKLRDLYYCCMTEYDATFKGVHIAFKKDDITDNLSSVVSAAGLKQFHITETTKYAHVTFFFNGLIETPYEGEDRKLIETIDSPSFADYPRMRAEEITKGAVEAIESGKYGFVLINLSNPDMIGHTGNIKAAMEAVEEVDKDAYQIAMATLRQGGHCIITADHGNCEEMLDKDGNMLTSHTTNPVMLWLVSDKYKNVQLKEGGKLANIAPTILKMLKIKKPKTMIDPLF